MQQSEKDRCIAAASAADKKRFWSKVKKGPKCWIWQACTRKGYGDFWVKGQNVRAHRASKMWSLGKRKAKCFCCHLCNNPSCVRPSHVYWGSSADNASDRVLAGVHKKSIPRGSASVLSVLNEAQAQEIVDKYYAGGVSGYTLGKEYKVSRGAIDKILRGKSWRHCVKIPNRKLLQAEKGYRRGSQSKNAKLTEAKVRAIRQKKAAGCKQKDLAKKYGILETTISAIIRRKTWRHVL